jgi:hypothetical protein
MAASDGRKAGDLGRFCLTVTSSYVFSLSIADHAHKFIRTINRRRTQKPPDE